MVVVIAEGEEEVAPPHPGQGLGHTEETRKGMLAEDRAEATAHPEARLEKLDEVEERKRMGQDHPAPKATVLILSEPLTEINEQD
jgi:hypothetical protein